MAHASRNGGNMEDKEKITQYLTAVYQNISTGVQSIEDIIGKVEDVEFKKELAMQEDSFLALQRECEVLAKSEKIDTLKDNNMFEKARLWGSINMSTMTDKSTRHIAELMLIGTFMGILTCIKDENDHGGVSSAVDEIISRLKEFERKNIDRLIPYLAEK